MLRSCDTFMNCIYCVFALILGKYQSYSVSTKFGPDNEKSGE
jgi:hypothetical protein